MSRQRTCAGVIVIVMRLEHSGCCADIPHAEAELLSQAAIYSQGCGKHGPATSMYVSRLED